MKIINGKHIPSGIDVYDAHKIDYKAELFENEKYRNIRNKWFALCLQVWYISSYDFYNKLVTLMNGMDNIARKYYFINAYDMGFEDGIKFAKENPVEYAEKTFSKK